MQLLRQRDLAKNLQGDLQPLLVQLQAMVDEAPTAEGLYALAELSFVAGKRAEATDTGLALDNYGSAVAYSYLYLFDECFGPLRNPYDPAFRGACDLYNGALEGALKIVQRQGGLLPGCKCQVESASQVWDVVIQTRGGEWSNDDFEKFEFVSDYEVQGLTNAYQSYGLGVPLIAVRKRRLAPTAPGDSPSNERYYPPELSFPVTAFLRVLPDETHDTVGGKSRHVALLELYDPLATTDTYVGRRRVPLESDLSTPLAFVLKDPVFNESTTAGLLNPERSQALAGLYMLQPYQPGKIPVLMVHGLWSSPLTWMEMFNDLRSDPAIRDRFQFWFYLYPTGIPYWFAAAQLRDDLRQLRMAVDPQGVEPALDRMVLVGHSMGGLVSMMQTVDSRDDFWRIVSDKPFESLRADPKERAQLRRLFYFDANPSVRRVVTIGTPHRGSKFASGAVRYLAQKLISLPKMAVASQQKIFRENREVFRDDYFMKVSTSLDSLSPRSPVFPVLLNAQHAPWVKYHTIIGVLPNEGLVGRFVGGTDGVVSYESAHLDFASSEFKIAADHSSVHRHPLSVLEVRRILLEHLAEGDAESSSPSDSEQAPWFEGVEPGAPYDPNAELEYPELEMHRHGEAIPAESTAGAR